MAIIEVKDLVKTYFKEDVETHSIVGMSFQIKEGEFVAIMGPSGSGKSTLLHILGFLDQPTKGEYRFDGKSVKNYSKDEIAHIRNREMGFVFQFFNLLPKMTVLENVKLPLLYSEVNESEWDKLAMKAVESVGLAHRMDHESSRLSGGEKQRVAIARALVNNPKVIFADEPTGNLDSKSGQIIMGILHRLNAEEKRTVILVTHETYTADHAERILHIRDGKIEKETKVLNRHSAEDGFIK